MPATRTTTDEASLLRAFRRAVDAKIARDLAAEDETASRLKATVLPAVRAALAEARAGGLCREAWLFGSFAWGQPSERSDVDVMVAKAAEPLLVASVVGRACGRDVHAIALERAPESLRERVLREGIPL